MLYPFKFYPILKSIIWGGKEIYNYKNLPLSNENIGESWEISNVPGNVSIVSNGILEGKSLDEIINAYKEKLLGKRVIEKFGLNFPLLIKFIDANDDLSIQVHPNDELAKLKHDSWGKTEMWYIIKAKENAYVYSGFNKQITPEKFENSLNDNSFPDLLKRYDVQPGDTFFLPAGQVHAIGAGCFIAEIQQSSDITYRIYDYDRKDKNGNLRELHTELAKEAIDYDIHPEYKIKYTSESEFHSLVRSTYFTTNLIEGDKRQIVHLTHIDTFVIYICLSGRIKLTDNAGNSVNMKQGETVLVPAENSQLVTIEVIENCKLLESYI